MVFKSRRSVLRGTAGVVGGTAVLGGTTAGDTEDITVERDVTYRETPQGTLEADLYLPDDDPRGTIVWVHGGFWARGDKSRLARRAADKAREGYAGVSINYRLSGEAQFPAAPVDVASAVSWTRAHADEFGFDTEQLALVGRSAGAHLAALVGVAPFVFLRDSEAPPATVDTVVGFYGIYDLRVFSELDAPPSVRHFLGGTFEERPEPYVMASPPVHLDEDSPSHLLLHGTDDEIVEYRASAMYHQQLQDAGVTAELFTARGAGHGFDEEQRWYGRTRGTTASWLSKQG
jgi:acetyl esterase/lipase